jgi:shikimate dehydrogenase
MEIRAASASDLAALEALFDEVDALHRDRLPDRYRAPDGPARSRDHLAAIVDSNDRDFLVAETAGDVLGVVQVELRDAPAIPIYVPRRIALVDVLVVAARARRRGVGRALMTAATAWSRERGARELELTVYAINEEAIAFYRALGYDVLSYRLHAVL